MKILITFFIAAFLIAPTFVAAEPKGQNPGTALLDAAEAGQTDVVKALLDSGANIESKNRVGATALTFASINGRSQVVKLLLDRGADVNVRTTTGITPLMAAASAGHADVVKLLLQKGADASLEDQDGDTALDMAEAEGDTQVSALLDSAEKPPLMTSSPVATPTAQVHREVIREADNPGGLTVRANPSPTGSAIAYLPVGSPVTYSEEASNGFVKLSGPIPGGWVAQRYLGSRGPEALVVRVDIPEQCLRVRRGPGTDHEKIGCLPRGAKLNLSGTVQNNWAEIVAPVAGWVSVRQIEGPGVFPPTPAASGAQKAQREGSQGAVYRQQQSDRDSDFEEAATDRSEENRDFRRKFQGALQGPLLRRGLPVGPFGTGKGY